MQIQLSSSKKHSIINLLIFLGVLAGCVSEEKITGAEVVPSFNEQKVYVQTITVNKKITDEKTDAYGFITPKQEITITSPIEGQVKKVLVNIGDYVMKNDQIIKIDQGPFEKILRQKIMHIEQLKRKKDLFTLELQQVVRKIETELISLQSAENTLTYKETELAKAEEYHKKQQRLYTGGAISKQMFERSKNALDSAIYYKNMATDELALLEINFKKTDNASLLDAGLYSYSEEHKKILSQIFSQTLALKPLLDGLDISHNQYKHYVFHQINPIVKQKIIAEANVELAELELELLEEHIRQTNIISPISGVISKKIINESEYTRPREPLLTVIDLSTAIAELMISAKDLSRLKVGQTVTFCSTDKSGEVVGVSPVVEPGSGMITVFIKIINNDHELKPGMFISGEIHTGRQNSTIIIPESSVLYRHESEHAIDGRVLIVRGDRIFHRNISLEKSIPFLNIDSNKVTVLQGLEPGEKIVVNPHPGHAEGTQVEILP